ncbi:hypothetical protein [Deinococcus ruber]|uniref:Uncharacterized protein n=1 Tax=Deinococcus ruber TaxID=1848197 RepID=A0A918BUU6_9DEIO|nr:hypothetical protein [Deinococcus ruber]GGQ93269.1 hypothetical protein GCM10008957_01580 [Deinococcus ruber]
MGTFDILVIPQRCEQCRNIVENRYQFKYGTPWQKEFSLGDDVNWEGNPIRWNGRPIPGLIVADAEIEPYPDCKFEYESSVIYIDNGKFIGAGRNSGRFQFGQDDYALPIESYRPLQFEEATQGVSE